MMTGSDMFSTPEVGFLKRLTVKHDSPWFSGHFPDMPIFPGVAMLDLMHRAVKEMRNGPAQSEWVITKARFRKPVLPGTVLQLGCAPASCDDGPGFGAWSLNGNGARISEATFVEGCAKTEKARTSLQERGRSNQSLFDVERFLPHRERMKLVDSIKRLDEHECLVDARVAPSWPTADGGKVSAVLSIELMAQAAAILNTYVTGELAKDKYPVLVGVNNAFMKRDYLDTGALLSACAAQVGEHGSFKVFECSVSDENAIVAGAGLLAYEARIVED